VVVASLLLACTGQGTPFARETGAGGDTPTAKPPPEGEPALYFTDGVRPKNVLMLSIDTTRRDQFGPYSVDGVDRTPFLTSIAMQGVRLSDHQQCSDWTYHSTSCTLNGRYAEDDGFMPALTLFDQKPLPDGQLTLAERLQEAGYYTILMSSNGWLGPAWNNAQGYIEAPDPYTSWATQILTDGKARLDAAIASGAAEKWFLHLHFIEPHPPYNPPEEYLAEEALLPPLPDTIDLTSQTGQYDATAQWPTMSAADQANLAAHLWARYHGELRYLDDQIAAFWAQLEAEHLLDDTLVVVWTDHGEQFWEHDQQSHAFYLGAEENDAVLFFWARNLPTQEWTRPTHSVDLVPTVLDALGMPPDPADPWFSGYVLGTAPDERPRFGSTVARLGPIQSVTLDGWKLTFNFAGVVRLYDRNTDRYELTDLYADHPDDPHVLPLWNLLLPRIQMLHELMPEKVLVYPEGLPTD
jgi:arylsulfatase A-like enzyme